MDPGLCRAPMGANQALPGAGGTCRDGIWRITKGAALGELGIQVAARLAEGDLRQNSASLAGQTSEAQAL